MVIIAVGMIAFIFMRNRGMRVGCWEMKMLDLITIHATGDGWFIQHMLAYNGCVCMFLPRFPVIFLLGQDRLFSHKSLMHERKCCTCGRTPLVFFCTWFAQLFTFIRNEKITKYLDWFLGPASILLWSKRTCLPVDCATSVWAQTRCWQCYCRRDQRY